MTDLPRAAPSLLAAVVAAAPPRLVKKLDQAPRTADAWTWSFADGVLAVTTDGGETVRLAAPEGAVVSLEGGACTCLLSPRCFHVLAVVAALAVEDGDPGGAANDAAGPAGDRPGVGDGVTHDASAAGEGVVREVRPTDARPVLPAEHAAAAAAWSAAGAVVAGGASAAGAVVQGELLRAAHLARAAGLARLAAGVLRLVDRIRALRAERADFALEELVDALEETLLVAALLTGDGAVGSSVRGVARRAYEPAGNLRVVGLFTEPIASATHAGVVTYVADEGGRIFTVNDVLPGTGERARAAYEAAVRLGDTSLAHRGLAREGLFVQDATASRDRRLGAGAGVKAVRASFPVPLPPLWDTPLAVQIERAYAALAVPAPERPAGDTLVFVEVAVRGVADDALVVEAPGAGALRLVAPTELEDLAYRENLRALAAAPGLVVRVVGRLVEDRPRTLAILAVLAVVAAEGAPALALPESWAGRVCLGLDRLHVAHVRGATRPLPVALALPAVDPLEPVRRRLARMALGGRGTLGPTALRAVEAEARALAARQVVTGAATLLGLAAAAGDRAAELARAWLAAAVHERAATRALRRAAWLG